MIEQETADLMAEQKAFYEARSSEYDEWWQRLGRYDFGPESNAAWKQEIEALVEAFDRLPMRGHVLEPAAGTGNWTQYLARRADKVTVVDASAGALQINRQRIEQAGLISRVIYYEADLFKWTSRRKYDVIFVAFWLSHLPSALINSFLTKMASMLKPEGILLMLEGLDTNQNTGLEELREQKHGSKRLTNEIERRTLNDGRTFRIVKRYDSPDVWIARLRTAHLSPEVGTSGEQFFYAIASKTGDGEDDT
jgi:demethylmenaquinone methyltransferase/2-methoxy-6-polyprenyl-1,4-benzoquinol methylase